MPFIAPLIPAIVGGVGSALAGSAVSGVTNAIAGAGKGPQQAALQQPINGQQVSDQVNQTNSSIAGQNNLSNQLAAQGGIQNQSNVYNQQQALANQLGAMAQGAGPNPALNQLNQTTGQNVQNQAALMAGQRGAGANAGLIARQAAMQGGNIQQQAAGQAATMRSQQQLNAIGALQQQQGMLGNLATTQVGQQSNAVGNLNSMEQNQQNALQQGLQGQNQQNISQQQNVNDINQRNQALQSSQAQQNTQGVSSGLGSAIGNGLTKALFAQGGMIPEQHYPALPQPEPGPILKGYTPKNFAEGGPIYANSSNQSANLKENYKGSSRIGRHLMMADGGYVRMESGGNVPGQPKVGGAVNSYSNDTIDAKLSPGEIVLPRSVTMSKDPVAAAAKFVATLKAKKGK